MTRLEATEVESLVANGRQRLDELIAGALNEDPADGVNREGGVGAEAGGELMRLWKEGKEKLAGLAGKGGEVRIVARCGEIRYTAGGGYVSCPCKLVFVRACFRSPMCGTINIVNKSGKHLRAARKNSGRGDFRCGAVLCISLLFFLDGREALLLLLLLSSLSKQRVLGGRREKGAEIFGVVAWGKVVLRRRLVSLCDRRFPFVRVGPLSLVNKSQGGGMCRDPLSTWRLHEMYA